ncbi:MAG: DUF4399 domain-containing protein [Stellaceae bacterium]
MLTRRLLLSSAMALGMPIRFAAATPRPDDAFLYIISPHDGARIKGAFWCRFGLRNMGVTHAGDSTPNLGHHHLLIDVSDPLNPNEPIPQDKNHMHFGAGQTEARIDLPRGKHTLQLVLGDANHVPFTPPLVSKKITITVL